MRQIAVTYHQEQGSWWAESDDLDGYTAAANSFSDLRQLVIEGVDFYVNGEPHVLAERLESGADLLGPASRAGGSRTWSWSGEIAIATSIPRHSVAVHSSIA